MGNNIYTVKNVKECEGREGLAFSANLYRNNTQVAVVTDNGNGGCFFYQWLDMGQPREDMEVPDREGHTYSIRCTPEEAIFVRHVRSQPEMTAFEPEDHFVSRLLDDYDENKMLRKLCRTKTVWRLKDDQPRNWFSTDIVFSTAVKEHMLRLYGDRIAEFANDRFSACQTKSNSPGAASGR